MKYDLSKKPTKGAQRNLAAFSSTLLELIAEKDFDGINVNEICERSNYPRATFYNYFDDKFDLLNYVWYMLAKEIKLDEFQNIHPDNLIPIYFDRTYDLFIKEEDFLDRIKKYNGYNGTLIQSLILYLKNVIREILLDCIIKNPMAIEEKIPPELLADHFTNTIMLILDWIFLKKQKTTKEEAHQYLNYLLNIK